MAPGVVQNKVQVVGMGIITISTVEEFLEEQHTQRM